MRLGDYMRKNICEPLGMKLTTFQPSQHLAVHNALIGMTLKTPAGELIPTDPVWKPDLKVDTGGAGMYNTPNEYIKILIALLKNDGVLLSPEAVDIMFQPHLEDDKYLSEMVKQLFGMLFTNGVTECQKWNFGLGGILAMEDGPGIVHKGVMSWGGHPNLIWWIDPTGGHCGLYASQLIPPRMQSRLNWPGHLGRHCGMKNSTIWLLDLCHWVAITSRSKTNLPSINVCY